MKTQLSNFIEAELTRESLYWVSCVSGILITVGVPLAFHFSVKPSVRTMQAQHVETESLLMAFDALMLGAIPACGLMLVGVSVCGALLCRRLRGMKGASAVSSPLNTSAITPSGAICSQGSNT